MSLVEMDEAYKARGGEQGWSSGKYTLEEVKNLHRMLDEFASKRVPFGSLGERTCR